jgi:hypothetical protein
MASGKFLWCRKCDAVHHVTSWDRAPQYNYNNYIDSELDEIPANDWHAFMKQHEGHRLEPLKAVGEKYFCEGSMSDPMGVAYIKVTNGHDHLLLRQSRKSIAEPLSFELTRGHLIDQGLTVCIQDSEIKKEMRYHFKWYADAFDDQKIDLFLQLFRDVVTVLEPEAIEVAGFCSEDDTVTFGLLPADIIETLMAKCARYFQPRELDDIRRFIDSHRGPCDVLALVMRRQLKFEQSGACTQ